LRVGEVCGQRATGWSSAGWYQNAPTIPALLFGLLHQFVFCFWIWEIKIFFSRRQSSCEGNRGPSAAYVAALRELSKRTYQKGSDFFLTKSQKSRQKLYKAYLLLKRLLKKSVRTGRA